MKKIKVIQLLGALTFMGILFAGCSNSVNNSSSGSDGEEVTEPLPEAPKDDGAGDGNGGGDSNSNNDEDDDSDTSISFRSVSTESLISREVYKNIYIPGSSAPEAIDTEHWFYDSTNHLTNYAVSTLKDEAAGAYQQTIFVFSGDPNFSDSGTGATSIYETDEFIAVHNPESNALYSGKYIYKFNSNNKCTAGGYIGKGESSIRSGCFTATYGTYGYTEFTEAETGTYTVTDNIYTITPSTSNISEYRKCEYDSTVGDYVKESFYSQIPASATDDSHLITRYTCRYNSDNEPELEVKYEPRNISDAPAGGAGTFNDGNEGQLNSNNNTQDATYSSKVIYEFSLNRNGDITLQKSFLYGGTAAIPPEASSITRDDYSDDDEVAILTRTFDSHNRKIREVETSYGNKVKTIVLHYDEGTTTENGLASETTYDANDLMVSRSTYTLIDFQYSNAGNTPVTGDTETYETRNYEYNTTRGYSEGQHYGVLRVKRPRTIHWCER